MTDFLVVGAGLAGLTFAREARAAGATVLVLDKGRGVGGRAATRRFADTRVDHGAPFFTVRTPAFAAVVEEGLAQGWARPWYRSVPLWDGGTIHERPDGHVRYACPDGMSALPKYLAQGVEVVCNATVQTMVEHGSHGTATTTDGMTYAGATLVLNLPPAQLQALRPTPALARVALEPCWALLVALEKDLAVDWPALELVGHPVFSWIARDHTKRPPGAPPTLVAHASAPWSETHLEEDREDVAVSLLTALSTLLGPFVVRESLAHRWRYAKPCAPWEAPYYVEDGTRLAACGDWCGGGRIEGAFTSGWQLARHLLR